MLSVFLILCLHSEPVNLPFFTNYKTLYYLYTYKTFCDTLTANLDTFDLYIDL